MRSCGERVSVYDRNGRFHCRGVIISRYYGAMSEHYDIMNHDMDMLRQIPASRIRAAYQPVDTEPKHIKEEAYQP